MESLGLCSPVAGWMVKTIRWPWTPISELQLAIGGGELGIRLCSGTISAILGLNYKSIKWNALVMMVTEQRSSSMSSNSFHNKSP